MTYLAKLNKIYINELKKKTGWIIYGQNIKSGSYVTGLTRNIEIIKKSKLINTTNSEYSIIGMGFGIMINGGHAVYFVKQLDFLLLGVDHFVNTLNHIKTQNSLMNNKIGSFTIITYVCDHGWHGSQSSFNNIDDLTSLAQLNSYQINTEFEGKKIIPKVLKSKGFNIISLGQRLIRKNILSENAKNFSKDFSVFEYFNSKDCLIISMNFAFPYAMEIKNKLTQKLKYKHVGILNVNFVNQINEKFILNKVKKQKKIIIITDTKSINSRLFRLIPMIQKKYKKKIQIIKRDKFNWDIQKDLFKYKLGIN